MVPPSSEPSTTVVDWTAERIEAVARDDHPPIADALARALPEQRVRRLASAFGELARSTASDSSGRS